MFKSSCPANSKVKEITLPITLIKHNCTLPQITWKQSPGTWVYYQNVFLRLTGISENLPQILLQNTEGARQREKDGPLFLLLKLQSYGKPGQPYRQRVQSLPITLKCQEPASPILMTDPLLYLLIKGRGRTESWINLEMVNIFIFRRPHTARPPNCFYSECTLNFCFFNCRCFKWGVCSPALSTPTASFTHSHHRPSLWGPLGLHLCFSSYLPTLIIT